MKIENLVKAQKVAIDFPDLLDACYAISIYDSEIKFQGKFNSDLVKSLAKLGSFRINGENGYVEGTITLDDSQVDITLTD